MPIVPYQLYSYLTLTAERRYALGSSLVDRGLWSDLISYSVNDVVDYSGKLYVAIQSNTDKVPSSNVGLYWSDLIPVFSVNNSNNTTPCDCSDSYARIRADDALTQAYLALSLGSNAYQTANLAYNLILSGSFTGTNFSDGQAYALAQIGTNVGSNAYNYAGQAYALAQIGTNVGSNAYSYAGQAYALAQIGTNVGSNAYSYAGQAYALAQIGTNIGSNAYNYADQAYALAQIGTDVGSNAYSYAGQAYALAQIGTNVGSNAYNYAGQAYALAQIGTNVGSNAYNYAGQAYALAQIGTNAVQAESGSRIAQDSYLNARIDSIAMLAGTVVPEGNIAGLGVPQLYVQVTSDYSNIVGVWAFFGTVGQTTGWITTF